MIDSSPRLGALRGATMTCRSVAAASATYERCLGFDVMERGTISSACAASWGAPACAGTPFAVLGSRSGDTTYVRFVEDPGAVPPKPYSTFGWAALEFSVLSSDAAIERLQQGGFTVIGPAQDLEFSKGTLRAGQVSGSLGEILYLTQINAQLDHYRLPVATLPIGRMFIVIAGVPSVDDAYRRYAAHLGTIAKDPFHAEIPFMAEFHGLARDHSYHVGCMETTPESYIEIDEMPPHVGVRAQAPGLLPPGIALVTCEVPSLEPFRAAARGPVIRESGPLYADGDSLTLSGPYGELLELIERR